MITYNHEKFIAQAIESVLMQETDFEVELVIGEDCSADGTRQIVQQYAVRYPQVIRALLTEHNLGMQQNASRVLAAVKGTYVAILEGDDYWTDARKLSRQVEMMDADSTLSLCFHRVMEYDELQQSDGAILPGHDVRDFKNPAKELIRCNFIPSNSRLMRRSMLPIFDQDYQKLKLGDWPCSIIMTLNGTIQFLPEVMSVYRIHHRGSWNGLDLETQEAAIYEMFNYLYAHAVISTRDLIACGLISYSRLVLLHHSFKRRRDWIAFAGTSLQIPYRLGPWSFTVQAACILLTLLLPRYIMRQIYQACNVMQRLENLKPHSLRSILLKRWQDFWINIGS